ncbi:P-loop containing nucleoside triphosphate hydrolase protein [Tribonema minus]|uniref:P-loop containing nucleoside triphosphate hydrolase protein n=1 Tax=Tribonema minus TaxID=303371 RepID=A0A835Z4U6_9STRA|nr:P-loop containing nucleoside triphosphate hydrolase protein [Tribonema minus]
MHNVGAVQELIVRQSDIAQRVTRLSDKDEKMDELVEQIQRRMAQEADAQLLERNRIREAEAARVRLEAELARARVDQARELEAERLAIELELVKAEVAAKAEAERANEDIELRKLKAKAEEDRKRVLEAVRTVFEHLATGVVVLLSDPMKAAAVAAWLLGLAAGYFILREAIGLCGRVISARLGRPSLVRETSRGWHRKSEDAAKEQVLSLATATRNARKNRAPFRHLLLYGPPGTGKTMVAKRLAACSGMDYAIMSGGDVGPLGKDAVTELHSLFAWARRSKRGVLLFIDEAEAFLGSRSSSTLSEDTRNALNALLYQTGTASHSFMLVLATNRAEDLDEAVLDRMDDSLLFPLPDVEARRQLLALYFRSYIASLVASPDDGERQGLRWLVRWGGGCAGRITVDAGIGEDQVCSFTKQVEGFSGREISKLLLSLQNAVFGSGGEHRLTKRLMERVFELKAAEHRRKLELRQGD